MPPTGTTLPFGCRPELAPATASLPGSAIALLVGVLAVGIGLWWRQRRQLAAQPTPLPAPADPWEPLARTIGQDDWYERLIEALLRTSPSDGAGTSVEARLRWAVARDTEGSWQRLYRHWEWATFAAYSGTREQHAADLVTAKRGWP